MLILEIFADQKQKSANVFFLLLLLVVYFRPSCVVQSPTVFLSVYLDFISMMPIEPPGNN